MSGWGGERMEGRETGKDDGKRLRRVKGRRMTIGKELYRRDGEIRNNR